MAEDSFVMILTGVIGSGKSKLGNFFIDQEAFTTKWTLKPVTTTPASYTVSIKGKSITMIDTPGFLDPSSLTEVEEVKEAVIDIPNFITAICLTINIQNRISKIDVNLLEKLLTIKEIIPYTFLVFTHAKELGNTEKEQRIMMEDLLKNTENCPEILQIILGKINNRFMLLESVKSMEEGYYENKCHELIIILQEIMNQNIKPLACTWNDIVKQLQNAEEPLAKKLSEENESNALQNYTFGYISDSAAAAVGIGINFSLTITSAISHAFNFIAAKFTRDACQDTNDK